jgi:hypothetical protein
LSAVPPQRVNCAHDSGNADPRHQAMNPSNESAHAVVEQWWVTSLGDLLVWARLRVLDSGTAEVLSAEGETLRYDDEDTAQMALLDAEFRAFDGLDEDDAAMLGFDLGSVAPPEAENDDDLLPLMTKKLFSRM